MCPNEVPAGTVPNRSQIGFSSSQSGRRPYLNDEDLQALARSRRSASGVWPTLDELIELAGGCQKQRASKAIAAAKHTESQLLLEHAISIPEDIQASIRILFGRWTAASLESWTPIHAALVDERDAARATIASEAETHRLQVEELRSQVEVLERRIVDLDDEIKALRDAIARSEAVAEERLRIIDMIGSQSTPSLSTIKAR